MLLRNCQKCSATGEVIIKNKVFCCDECKGRGFVIIPLEKELCPICKGIGTQLLFETLHSTWYLSCKNCDGQGFVDPE